MAAQRVSDANVITAQYMDSLLIEERLIGSTVADLHCEFFGRTYDMPVRPPSRTLIRRFCTGEISETA